MNTSPVRCKGCRRLLGASGKVVSNVICTRSACRILGFPPVITNEDRDGVMEALERLSVDRATIARVGGVTTQRVGQILTGRST